MMRAALVTVSLSLALGALLVMFTPFLRDFTTLHLSGEQLMLGAFVCGLLCFLAVSPARRALVSLLSILLFASLIEGVVIALPALRNLVPNPVSYINLAEQQMFLGCTIAGPLLLAGGVLGGVLRARLS